MARREEQFIPAPPGWRVYWEDDGTVTPMPGWIASRSMGDKYEGVLDVEGTYLDGHSVMNLSDVTGFAILGPGEEPPRPANR